MTEPGAEPMATVAAGSAERELGEWLAGVLAEVLQRDCVSIRRDVPLSEYGVDSLVAATLIAEVEDELGVWVDPGDVPPGISLDELAGVVGESRSLSRKERAHGA